MLKIFLSLLFIFFPLFGCDRRKEDMSQQEEPQETELTLPQIPSPAIPYKPTSRDIQTALKNAGFYKGRIDGDIGPLSKEAIRQFQSENDLVVDGKVGPKTWVVLGEYLSTEDTDSETEDIN